MTRFLVAFAAYIVVALPVAVMLGRLLGLASVEYPEVGERTTKGDQRIDDGLKDIWSEPS